MTTFFIISFWICLALLFYAYVGYGILLYILIKLKRLLGIDKPKPFNEDYLPPVTLLVAAYNEADFIEEKIHNSLAIDYPKDKLKFLFITDGSDDGTPDIVARYPEIKLMHQPPRAGKIAAVHRAMPHVDTPITIYTDANTYLNKDVVRKMVRHYEDPRVGAVAGEKRIRSKSADSASGAGEGLYWKYESTLKKWDSELYSVVGAAGELFSIRTELHEEIPTDTVIEDFYTTMRIAQKGYRVRYEPEAYATEGPSASVKEELKRKVRIAAGGIQAIVRLAPLLNIFKYGILTFQYVSHRVLRWTLAPVALFWLMVSNIVLAAQGLPFYQFTLLAQIAFYLAALMGYLLEKKQLKVKAFFVPYYFFIMNYACYAGFLRYVKGSQSVLWERAKRG
ncbi:MAG: glycosyltransferase family 2 protein [Bacteroidetes bacterium]|nr:MAG: glycosyltransferase family 2 protein [Bacteroidota bacterium]